jgi:TonB family protein
MRAGILVVAGALGAIAPALAGDAEPAQWQGALDLRKAITIKSERVAVDPHGLAAAGVAWGAFSPPRRTKGASPIFPDQAARAGAQGRVLLECRITESGTVDACRVSQSVYPALDRAAADAIRHWKYEPARVSGQPRSIVVQFLMIFALQ